MTVHDFDMARYLLGSDVREVYAKADVLIDPLVDKIDWDTAVVTLTFENGALGRHDCYQQARGLAATKSVKESRAVTIAKIM